MNASMMGFTRCAFFLLVGGIAACRSEPEPWTPVQRQMIAAPKLVVVQTKQPPQLDGSLGDPVWSFANTTDAFVDTRYDSRRVPQPFGHTDWDSGVRVGVSSRGDLDDEEADAGYTVEMAIPWQAFSLDANPLAPPAIGAEWRANLYGMDLIADRRHAAAWSPPRVGDFHVPRRFGILAFEGAH